MTRFIVLTYQFIVRILRLPFDLILLTFHWVKGTVWLVGYVIKDYYELPNELNWPYGCLTTQTKSDEPACLPGRKYGNPLIFKFLCPDHTSIRCGGACESRCMMKLYEVHDCWKPPWSRICLVGIVLAAIWSYPTYCFAVEVKKYIPRSVKQTVKSVLTGEKFNSQNSIMGRTLKDRKGKAEKFLIHAEKLQRDNKFLEAVLEYNNCLRHDNANVSAYWGRAQCLVKLGRMREAIEAFKQTVDVSSDMWEAHLELARLGAKFGDYELARTHAEKVCRLKPENPDAYLILSICLLMDQEIAEAKAAIGEAIAKSINNPDIYVIAGYQYFQLREFEASESCYQSALAMDTLSINARVGLAYLYMLQERFAEAEEHVEYVLQKDPLNLKALECKAEFLIQNNQMEKATEILESILRLDPTLNTIRVRLADVLVRSQKIDRGIELLKSVILEDPRNFGARVLLAESYLKMKLYSSAIEQASAVIDRNNKIVRARLILIKAYHAQNRYEDAIKHIEKGLAQQPKNLEMKLMLGEARYQLGDKSKAVECYMQVAKDHPDSVIPLIKLGYLQTRHFDIAAAIDNYTKALEIEPDNPYAANNLANLLINHKQKYAEAEHLIRGFRKRFPNSPEIADTLGFALYHLKQNREARKLFEFSIRLNGKEPVYYYHLAMTLIKDNDLAAAMQALQTALSLSRDFDGADHAEKMLIDLDKGESE